MTKQEVAGKAIELHEAITKLLDEKTPDPRKAADVAEYNVLIKWFGDIFKSLTKKRFDLERIKLGRM